MDELIPIGWTLCVYIWVCALHRQGGLEALPAERVTAWRHVRLLQEVEADGAEQGRDAVPGRGAADAQEALGLGRR